MNLGVAHARAFAREIDAAAAFVPADNDDAHARSCYEAVGGAPAAVTIFGFEQP